MNATCVCTRQSIGTQVRKALDAMLAKGQIGDWTFSGTDGYELQPTTGGAFCPISLALLMELLNAAGYDIRFGKA